MITDADCQPQPGWIKAFSGMFARNYDFIFGPAPFKQSNKLINKISCFENLRSSVLIFSAAELNLPYSAAARSFGFKKVSFEKIGGFKNTAETLSGDDDMLLREAIRHKMNISTINEKEAYVYSDTVSSFKGYFQQKARHTKTSIHYLLSRQLFLGGWHLLNIICLILPVAAIISPFFLLPAAVKILLDFTIIKYSSGKYDYRFNYLEIFYLQILYEVFIITNFLGALLKKDSW